MLNERGLDNPPSKEKEKQKFEAVIVLGKNWREYPPEKRPEDWKLHLSIESEMSALAAGELYKQGRAEKLIFSTGKTAGQDEPSEAEAMWLFLKKYYPDIPAEAIVMEEESIDTPGNAEEVLKILQREGIENAALLTVGFHLPRSQKIFAGYGIPAAGLSSEEILIDRSPKHYGPLVKRFKKSARVKVETGKEALLRTALLFDPKGKLPQLLSQIIRNPKR